MKFKFNAHILAFTKAAWTTPDGFEAAVLDIKRLGFETFVVVPTLFQGHLTMEQVGEIALRHSIKLICCGFRAKAEVSPYSTAGLQPAITEFRQQFSWQKYFKKIGAGDNLVCGPVLDDWGAGTTDFNIEGFQAFAQAMSQLGEEMELTICVEVVNEHESGITSPHTVIPAEIKQINNPHFLLHTDIVHIASYVGMEGVLPFLEENSEIIGTMEVGMPGRCAMKDVPAFDEIADAFFTFVEEKLPGCFISLEQFDKKDVIDAFGLPHVYSSDRPGVEVLKDDVNYLIQRGLMPALAA